MKKESRKQEERGIYHLLSCQVNRYRTIYGQGGGSNKT